MRPIPQTLQPERMFAGYPAAGTPKRRCQDPGVSLYRTWRPRTFAELVGQDAVVRTLTSAIESGKLAHAYLFSGPRGSGKTSAAKILARCINCVLGPIATPDNTCENCQAILAGTALDVLEIDAASNRGIDEIRALRDAVKYPPSVMRMKVYIIDEAHMLTKEGANAFLKTLEEPPPHVVFILATTEPEKLPLTVLSRCQRYAFRRIAIPVMIERMREIAAAENIAVDEPALAAIAYRADGGLRDALTMLEQAAAFATGKITPETIDLAFGASGRNYARSLLDQMLACDAAAALQTIEAASDAGTDIQVLMRSLIAEFRNLLVARVDPELLKRDLAPEDAAYAAERARDVPQGTLVRALRALSDALSLARLSGNPRLELETALLRFVLEDPAPAVTAVPRSAPKPAAPEPKITAAAPPAASKSSEPPTLPKLKAAWGAIRSRVEGQRASLRGELARVMLDAIEGQTLVMRVPSAHTSEILRDNHQLIESAIQDVTGASLKVVTRIDGTARAKDSEPPEDADQLFQYASERIGERQGQ
jgi:DNA polymerase-3 subunit gamma/tau